MQNYLYGKEFNTYVTGVPNGKIIFEREDVYHRRIDRKTRVLLNRDKFPSLQGGRAMEQRLTMIDYRKLYNELSAYTDCTWEGEHVKLQNGKEYDRYLEYTGIVDGKKVTTILWALHHGMGNHGCARLRGKGCRLLQSGARHK